MIDWGAPICALLIALPSIASCGGAPAPPHSVQDDSGVGPCNQIAVPASIAITAGAGSMPAAAGGAIVEGTYTLSELDDYETGDGLVGGSSAGVMIVSAEAIEAVLVDSKGTNRFNMNYTLTGTTIRQTGTCGFADTVSEGYTATPSTLVLIQSSPALLSVFTRQ